MATKRPFVTKKYLRDMLVLLVASVALVLVAGPFVKGLAMEHIFNPDKLDPYRGLRPGVTMTVTDVAATSPEPVSAFEWHDAYELQVTNTGGLTLGGLRLDPTVEEPVSGESSADRTWVRVVQDGRLVMDAVLLTEMNNQWLRVADAGFKPGEKTLLTVQFRMEAAVSSLEAATFSFAVTAHKPFQPGQDSYESFTR